MICLEYYCKRALLIGVCPLEGASEQGIHSGNKSSLLLFLLHDLAYVWYFSTNMDISVLHPTMTESHYIFYIQIYSEFELQMHPSYMSMSSMLYGFGKGCCYEHPRDPRDPMFVRPRPSFFSQLS